MAKKSLKEEEIKTWRGRIELAREYQREAGNQDQRWDKHVKGMAGDFDSRTKHGSEAIDVNMIHATNKTALPPLWLIDPHVTFKPTRARIKISGNDVNNMERAKWAEVEINYWLKELKVREKVTRPCVLDAEATNHGYAYVWYVKDKSEVEQDGERTEPNPRVQHRRPIVLRVSPKNLFFPPGKWDMDEMPWIVVEWVKPYEDALKQFGMNEETLKPSDRVRGESTRASRDLHEFMESPDAQFVRIQQAWDTRKKKIYTFAVDGSEKQLAEDDWTVELEGFPIVDLSFVDIPDEYYGTPPVQYYYPQQIELNAARTKMRKRFNRSKSMKLVEATLDDEAKQALKDGEDLDIVSVDFGGEPAQSKIFQETPLPPDNGVLAYESRIVSDILQITGSSAEQRGSGDPNVDSATASANIQQGVQIRSSDRGDRVRTFYIDIARKLWMILRQIPSEKRDRLVAGPIAGSFREVTYTTKELRGEFALTMDLASVLPESPVTRQIQAKNNYILFRQDPLINPEQLVLDVYRSQNVPNPEQYLLFLRQPAEELQQMLQGMPVEPHERDQHEQHMQEHEAQAEQLEDMLDQLDPQSDEGRKLRGAMFLLMAHMNATVAIAERIAQGAGRAAGNPISDNQLRTGTKQIAQSETAAELGGNPMTVQ